VFGPAASRLLHSGWYGAAVLRRGGSVPLSAVGFDYGDVTDVLTTIAELAVAAVLVIAYLRRREPRAVSWLRAVHTGSVNDYAAFSIAGFLVVFTALTA
jgi:multicomponent Na+:H+ antiporter subunit D